jgi:diacylglycerol kinase family enzyme
VLGQVGLDLGDAGTGPILEPGLVEIVLDAVEATFAHGPNYRLTHRTTPWAERLISRRAGPMQQNPGLVARFLVVNPRAGDQRPGVDELVAAARERGIEPHVVAEGENPTEVARSADADVLGIAGGDGSVASVAAVAVERDVPLVCVPFGTRNHFARDLGLDRDDPIGSLAGFDGTERRVDVGRAGDRLFLNNVSLGVYARLVHRRERHRRRREALARVRSWLILLTHREPLGITIDGRPEDTRLVLVANNRYELELPTLGVRERLDEGCLYLYVLGGGADGRRGERFTIDSRAGRVEAAVDGEAEVLKTPVEFRVEPEALRVLLPPDTEPRS